MKPENTSTLLAFDQTAGDHPLLLLHGFLEDRSIWSELFRSTGPTRTLIAPDLPGHGESGVLADVHSMELMAQKVFDLLDHLEIDQCSVMGHSMGGYVALAMAELAPQRMSSLVLLNSTSEADSQERKKNRDRALKLIGDDHRAFVRQAIPALFPTQAIEKHRAVIDRLVERASHFPVEGIRAAIKGMRNRPDRSSVLADLNQTKYWLAGKADNLVAVDRARALAARTGTQFKMLDGGHMSWAEEVTELTKFMHFID